MRRCIMSCVVALGLAVVACAPPGTSTRPSTAATVNGENVTLADVRHLYDLAVSQPGAAEQIEADTTGAAQRQGQAQILTQLIQSQLLQQGASELGVEVTREDIATQRAAVIEQLGGEEAFNDAIQQRGLTEDDVRNLLRDLALREGLQAELTTDERVRTYFEDNAEQFDSATARHILVKTQRQARDVLRDLRRGGDFAEIARKRSQDPGSADSGGELGQVGRGDTVAPFERALFGAPVGEVVGPVETEFGFHVIEVTERSKPKLADVSDQIRAQVGQSVVDEFLAEQAQDAQITVNPRFGTWNAEQAQVVPERPLDGAQEPGQPTESSS